MSRQIVVLIMGELALVAFLAWLVSRSGQAKARLRAETYTKLIERFATVQEMSEFLESALGRRLLGALAPPQRGAALSSLLAIQAGIVLAVAGLGLLLAASFPSVPQRVLLLGTLVTALGLGALLSGFLARRLSVTWGLVPREVPRQDALPER